MDVHASMISVIALLLVGFLNLLGFEEYTGWHFFATLFGCMVDYDWLYNWVAIKHHENKDVLLWRWIYDAMNTLIWILATAVWWFLYNWYLFLTLNHRPNTPSAWAWRRTPVPLKTMYTTFSSMTTIMCGLGIILFLGVVIKRVTIIRNYCRAHYSHKTTASQIRQRSEIQSMLDSANAYEVAQTREQHGEGAAARKIIERATEKLDAFEADQAREKEQRAKGMKQADEAMDGSFPSFHRVGERVFKSAIGLGKMAGQVLTGHSLASAAGAALVHVPEPSEPQPSEHQPSGPLKRNKPGGEQCPGKTVKGIKIVCPHNGVITTGKMCDQCRHPTKKPKS